MLKSKKLYIIIVAFLVFLFTVSQESFAREEYVEYNVHIKVEEDASLLVTESYRVNVEGRRIRRGLTYFYPSGSVDASGVRNFDYELISLLHNGEPSEYIDNSISEYTHSQYHQYLDIGTGNDDFLEHGEHTFQITYRTYGHVLFEDDFDGIIFDVIPIDKEFPIQSAVITVELPNNLQAISTQIDTGAEGEIGRDYRILRSVPNDVYTIEPSQSNVFIFEISRPFTEEEGVTLEMRWEKGHVQLPEIAPIIDEERNRISDFTVDIFVEEDGALRVKETIVYTIVNNRGFFQFGYEDIESNALFRYYYKKFKYPDESFHAYTFDFISATINNEPAENFLENYNDTYEGTSNSEVILGPMDTGEDLDEGVYTFEIEYRTKGHVNYYRDSRNTILEAVYFEAINTYNPYQIEHATLNFHGLSQKDIVDIQSIVSNDFALNNSVEMNGIASFSTTRPLEAHEAFGVYLFLQDDTLPYPHTTPNIPTNNRNEFIMSQDIVINVQNDGALHVVDTIHVQANVDILDENISLSFPRILESEDVAERRSLDYEILSVHRDGVEKNFRFRSESSDFILEIEDYGTLPWGQYIYEIEYIADGYVYNSGETDNLYFNAVHNNELPIERLSVEVIFPENVQVLSGELLGNSGKGSEQNSVQNNPLLYTNQDYITAGDDFIVSIAVEQGVLTLGTNFGALLSAHRNLFFVLAIIAQCIFLFFLWYTSYRTKNQTVIPLFSPAEGLSPHIAAALYHKSVKPLMVQVEILWLAVNGYIKLSTNEKKELVIERTQPTKNLPQWIAERCQATSERLFRITPEGKFTVTKESKTLGTEYTLYEIAVNKFFTVKPFLPIIGVLVAVIVMFIVIPYIPHPSVDGSTNPLYVRVMFSAVPLIFAFGAIAYAGVAFNLFFIFMLLPYIFYTTSEDILFTTMYLILTCLPIVFVYLFAKKLTPEGEKLYTQMLGLRMYIKAAEEDRLKFINPPAMNVEKYEELLPYAMALDCADEWEKYYDKLLEDVDYTPEWYSDNLNRRGYLYHREIIRESMDVTASASRAGVRSNRASRAGSSSRSGRGGRRGGGFGGRGGAGRGSGGGRRGGR